MNKRNSILESLSEGMLNSTNQINSVKHTKIGDKFVKYISNVRDELDYDDFYGFVSTYATNSASKYTKVLSGYNRLSCFNDYWSIECGDCEIRIKTNNEDEIYVFVDNPYSNENTETQVRDNNILVYKGDFSVLIEGIVVDMVQSIDGRCSTIDKYVDLITDYLKEEGYTYFGTTYGIDMSASGNTEIILEEEYSLLCVCVGDEFYGAFTDDILGTVVDASVDVFVAKLYSKLKLPTLGCRLTISFISSKEAKNVLKMLKGIGVDSCVNSLKVVGTSLVIEVY